MKFSCIYFFGLLVLISSCGPEKIGEVKNGVAIVDTVASQEPAVSETYRLETFQNMEMIEYCLLLPLSEYTLVDEKSEKAAHSFIHKTKKDNTMAIQGLLRANSEVSIEEYFKNSLEDAELEGKIIEKKELKKDKNCFYAKGYWNNSIHESRFIEVCWLRSDEVVKYYSSFDIADTTLWNKRLEEILKSGSVCK